MEALTEKLLTKEQIDFYKENGFVQVENVLTAEELAEMRQFLTEAMEGEDGLAKTVQGKDGYGKFLNQKVNTWRDHLGMAKYVSHSKFANLALQLTGANEIRVFHDHGLWKMPLDSKPTPWHQDTPYWPFDEARALSIWITLDDVDEKNGCMKFIPGSHKAGKFSAIDWNNPKELHEFLGKDDVSNKPVKVPLKAGSCTFHCGLTFHSAYANLTENPRRVLAIIYMPNGTTFNGKEHPVTKELGLIKGEPVQGPLFPIVACK